jgi:hypothetical protein
MFQKELYNGMQTSNNTAAEDYLAELAVAVTIFFI